MVDPSCLARNRLNLLRRRTATITRCTHKTRHLGSKREHSQFTHDVCACMCGFVLRRTRRCNLLNVCNVPEGRDMVLTHV